MQGGRASGSKCYTMPTRPGKDSEIQNEPSVLKMKGAYMHYT